MATGLGGASPARIRQELEDSPAGREHIRDALEGDGQRDPALVERSPPTEPKAAWPPDMVKAQR